MKKRPHSLRNQLTTFMAALVALQSIALVAALFLSQVFSLLDTEAFRLFDNTTESRAESLNASLVALETGAAYETQNLASDLGAIAAAYGTTPGEIYKSDELYEYASHRVADSIMNFVASNTVTGAYVFWNYSHLDPTNTNAHSAMYIRNTTPGEAVVDYSSYVMEIGPSAVMTARGLTRATKWAPGVEFLQYNYNYYTKPFEAALDLKDEPDIPLMYYGYWNQPIDILGDGQAVISYSLPLLDKAGVPFGVFGFEVSLDYLNTQFLHQTELPYENSFLILANILGDAVPLDWYIPSSPLAEQSLPQTSLYLNPGNYENIYEVSSPEMRGTYAAVNKLRLYHEDSPFADWALIAFVPKDVLHKTSSHVETLLLGSILIITVVALLGAILLPIWATRKIRGLSQNIKNVQDHRDVRIPRTRFREMDELIVAVETLNKRAIDASERLSQIMELTAMPIGGYDIQEDSDEVFLTEYIHTLLGLEAGTSLSRESWKEQYALLTANPEPGRPNVYAYTTPAGEKMWLRIVESPTGGGIVGIVVDVSKDIEEHRRLSHELDYDSLTGLYSRYAFGRVAYRRIRKNPDGVGAMIFADLDNLKGINDHYGHDVGDRFLQMAGRMFANFADSGAIVARIAGDEFAIYLHGDGQSQDEISRQLYALMRETRRYLLQTPDGKKHHIQFSAGVSWYPRDAQNIGDLLKLADYAMYEAKHSSKGTVVEFNLNSYKQNSGLVEAREILPRTIEEELEGLYGDEDEA